MKMKEIFVKNRNGIRELYTKPCYCDICNKYIDDWGMYKEQWTTSKKVGSRQIITCPECRDPIKTNDSFYEMTTKQLVMITKVFPRDSFLLVPQAPQLVNRKNLSVFDVADIQLGTEIVEDYTVHSGRLQSDYDPELLEKRDRALLERDQFLDHSPSDDEALNLLSDLQATTDKLLSEENKSLLENNKEKE